MTRIEKSIIIQSDIEEVFKYASDFTKWKVWFEGVSDFTPSTEKTRGNATRYTYKAKMMGLKVNLETEIHEFVENRGWTGRATKGMPHQTFWKFEPVDLGTKMTYGLEYSIEVPFIGRWLDNTFIKPQWNKIISKSLENLKHVLEKQN